MLNFLMNELGKKYYHAALDAKMRPFTASFWAQGERMHFYFLADDLDHAEDTFQMFLFYEMWLKIQRPNHDPYPRSVRTAEVRSITISAGWPEGVAEWDSVKWIVNREVPKWEVA